MSLDFNTLLAQAAELKEAQLRQTRREYEAAPECLRYTLVRGAGPNASHNSPAYECLPKALSDAGRTLWCLFSVQHGQAYSRDAAVVALRQGPAPARLHAAEEHKARACATRVAVWASRAVSLLCLPELSSPLPFARSRLPATRRCRPTPATLPEHWSTTHARWRCCAGSVRSR